MPFRVIAGSAPALLFENPLQTLRAASRPETQASLERADAALKDGRFVAGFIDYEGSSVLGIFSAPRVITLAGETAPFALGPLLPRIDARAYGDAIARIAHAIGEGDVYQVNYTVPFDAACTGDPLAAFARLSERNAAGYNAYVEDGETAILSLSPELFLRFEGERLVTKPMKGTAPLERAWELDSPKNRAEHVMIVDLLRNDLHRLCDDVRVERLFEIERYPTFATMTSTIAGRVRAATPLADVFAAMFPCGSITGAPKRAAMEQIAAVEPHARGPYTGTVGYLGPGRAGWWNVAIRSLRVDRSRQRATYNAGGGIVADSLAADEWNEVMLKTRSLRPAIEPFRFWESFRGGPHPSDIAAHLARLERTARRFGVPFDRDDAARRIAAAAATQTPSFVRVRLTLDGDLAIDCEPLAPTPSPVRLCLAAARVDSSDPMLAVKSSWRPAHALAAGQAAERRCFDALLQNERDELTEGSRTTIFVQSGNTLSTPPLACGVLPGILRAELVQSGRAVERVLHLEDLRDADAFYVGNSARGLLQADLIGEPFHV